MKKYKIGYTTGVFDMFHIGHLNILKRAKEQCDFLIVGVSTDENVMNYKHKIPQISFEQRAAIVESIKYVDKVVPQVNMDKFEAWNNLHFDAIFHGDDWKGSSMYDEIQKKFESVGVDMIFLPHTDGISSTILRDKINDHNSNGETKVELPFDERYNFEIDKIYEDLATLKSQHIYEIDKTTAMPRASTLATQIEDNFKDLLDKIKNNKKTHADELINAMRKDKDNK